MTTLRQMKLKIIDLLGDDLEESSDPVEGGLTQALTLVEGIRGACIAIAKRQWKPSVFTVEGGENAAELPTDLLDVEGVIDLSTGKSLPQIPLQVGGISPGLGWNLYPSGQITFNTALGSNGAKIYYSAVWNGEFAEDVYGSPDDDQILDTPVKFDTAVAFYAAYYCLLRRSSASANLRQFNTKVDSGQPEDSPLKDQAREFLMHFNNEMKTFPQMQKGLTA